MDNERKQDDQGISILAPYPAHEKVLVYKKMGIPRIPLGGRGSGAPGQWKRMVPSKPSPSLYTLGKGTLRISVDHSGNPWLRLSQEHRNIAHEPVGSTDQSHIQNEHPTKCSMHHRVHPNERTKELCLVVRALSLQTQKPESEFSALYKTLNMAKHVL